MFVIFLLALNVLFLSWQYWRPVAVSHPGDVIPSAARSIELKRERAPVVPAETNKKPVSGLVPARFICRTIGPFSDQQQATQLAQSMSAVAGQSKIRVIEESEPYRYWVFLPVKNKDEAATITNLLIEKQITDYYLMGSGDEKRISLGRFKEKTYADKRLQQLKDMGFDVVSEVVFNRYQLIWLDYELAEAKVDQAAEIIKPFMQDEIAVLDRECEN